MWKRASLKNGQETARKCVGYIRVSTSAQVRDGVSLEAQEAALRAFCANHGRDLAEVFSDAGLSAKNCKRPGFQLVLAGVRSGEIGSVVVYSLSRATRSTRDLSDLLELFKKHSVEFVSVTENLATTTAMGRAMVEFIGVLAQLEREVSGERTSDALAHKRRSRKAYGQVPFGYRRDGDDLVPIPDVLAALDKARKMDKAGTSLRKIAAMFEKRGIKPRGVKWYPASVKAVLQSKMTTEAA